MTLPATLRPWQEVSLYSRATGYLDTLYVDINSFVDKDEWMANISAPDVDAQLVAAEATLVLQQAAAAKAQAKTSTAA